MRYLELSGRPPERIDLVSAYAKAQGTVAHSGRGAGTITATCSSWISGRWSRASQVRAARRIAYRCERQVPCTRRNAQKAAEERSRASARRQRQRCRVTLEGKDVELKDGAVLIAAITSCTNTSNPSVMLGAGLLARKARERGFKSKPWVKTSLAPGSRVVTDYFTKSRQCSMPLAAIGFDLVGYGCTTCIAQARRCCSRTGPAAQDRVDAAQRVAQRVFGPTADCRLGTAIRPK